MLYRTFPKIPDKPISVLGFPVTASECGSKQLIQRAYEEGINYYDTSYIGRNCTNAEWAGGILRELHIREKVYIADTLPVYKMEKEEDWRDFLKRRLTELQTGYIDFLIAELKDDADLERIRILKGFDFFTQAQSEGIIRHTGFSLENSVQSNPEIFRKIAGNYDQWAMCKITYHYLNADCEAVREILSESANRGLGIIAADPLRGGLLTRVPPAIIDIFAHADVPRIPAEWALRSVWERQEIVSLLPKMTNLHDILSNCAFASAAKPNSLPRSQLQVIGEAAAWLKEHTAD